MTQGQPTARTAARLLRGMADVLVLSLAYWAAFFLRFDGVPPLLMFKRLVFTWPYVVGLEVIALYAFSIPYFAWRYIGLRDVQRVAWATAAASSVLLALRFASPVAQRVFPHAVYALVPLGVIAANALLAFLGVVGIRVLRRIVDERARSRELESQGARRAPTLLVGAGQAGVMVAREIAARPDLPFEPVGFVDDDAAKVGTIIHGIKVLGTTSDMAALTRETGATQAIITVANATGAQIRNIKARCESVGITPKIIPGIYEILDGKVNLSRIREVSIEDLLGRDAVTLDLDLVQGFVTGKRVLVTGAGGSIGSELCRQVSRFRPERLFLVEQAEFNLFSIHQELVESFPELPVVPVICDVCDTARIDAVFATTRPDVVFHAAAHKHVPMMEWNPGEAIKNNVFGTKKVADAADRVGCATFVLISTDKAVNPTSIMGGSKRAAEMYIQALSQRSATKFVAVRFGNVLGSAGSVIPTFKAQIAAGGPVKVTHPDMMRHFMTIPEASQLVMQAAAIGRSGEILLLDMGEAVKIVHLAEDLIRLSGFEPGVDIDIVFSGVRPGEKLHEELAFDAENVSSTGHDKIFVGNLRPCDAREVDAHMTRLAKVTGETSPAVVRAELRRLVTEMREPPQISLPDPARNAAEPEQAAMSRMRAATTPAE